ncbi:MAG: cytochrome c-type biogenesis protein CcmH [Cocleimonas sp.]|nr:cytochrome c-type biogenesis protein CcmH [Cocleimonas sp.]
MNALFKPLHLKLLLGVFLLFFVLGMTALYAVKIEFHSFENKAQEKLYLQLIAELRCVKCQNQNLAESNAELAKDMREKAYELIIKGGSRDDVVNYMTARYGDFVLYKPPFKMQTLLLWVGPPIFLFLSLLMLFRLIRNQKNQPIEKLSETDRDSVRDLLTSNKEK